MKKIVFLLALLVFIGNVSYSQIPSIDIWSIEPGRSFNAGDSIYFNMSWDAYESLPDQFFIGLYSKSATLPTIILEMTTFYNASTKYYNKPQYTNHACGCLRIGYKIPADCGTDSFTVSATRCPEIIPNILITALPPVTGIAHPMNNKAEAIRYYNEQGSEIQKPESGFYIWRSSTGQSGKSFMLQ